MIDTLPDLGIAPDWGLSEQSNFRVRSTPFGDGYTLREPEGLNSVQRGWNLTWTGLDKEPAIYLYNWLLSRKGVFAFLWNKPETDEYVKVIGDAPTYTYDDYGSYTVSVAIKEDFNP